jgi:nucleotide-binding universal stress UspA family protein
MATVEVVTKELTDEYRVVVACDFSPLGDRAVGEALRLCSSHPAAELHVITVGVEIPSGILLPGPDVHFVPHGQAQEAVRAHVGRLVDAFLARANTLTLDRVAVYTTVGTPSERILALAAGVDADLIVLGTHSRHGLARLLLGSVAEAVVRRASCGVLVIRPRDFLGGEKLPEIQPPLQPGEHALLPFRTAPTYHYVHRLNQEASRLMPSI